MVKATFVFLQLLLATSAVLASNDCQNQLGGAGHLVAIETSAEWDFLTVALESYGFGTTFWTSGMYDPSRAVWRWTKNDESFAFNSWGPGFPSTPNQLIRVLIYYTNRYDAHWRTVPNTQLHRYICELQL
ncbi:Lithostathine-2, partial [Pseudolycoriella hygida]